MDWSKGRQSPVQGPAGDNTPGAVTPECCGRAARPQPLLQCWVPTLRTVEGPGGVLTPPASGCASGSWSRWALPIAKGQCQGAARAPEDVVRRVRGCALQGSPSRGLGLSLEGRAHPVETENSFSTHRTSTGWSPGAAALHLPLPLALLRGLRGPVACSRCPLTCRLLPRHGTERPV